MLGFNRWHLLTGLAATLCMVGIVSLALIYFFPAPRRNLQSPQAQEIKSISLSATGIGKYLRVPTWT
jgi:hypothetical protein